MEIATSHWEMLVTMGGSLSRNDRNGRWFCSAPGILSNSDESPEGAVSKTYWEWMQKGASPFHILTQDELVQTDKDIHEFYLREADRIRAEQRTKAAEIFDIGGEG